MSLSGHIADELAVRAHQEVLALRSEQVTPGDGAWPVGAVFISTTNVNPGTSLGFGTWVAFGAGRVMVGYDGGDTDFDSAGETGGAKTVAAAGANAAPTFTGSAMAGHTHTIAQAAFTTTAVTPVGAVNTYTGGGTVTTPSGSTSAGTPAGTVSAPAFTGTPTSVVQPYIVCFFWQRTA